MFTFSIRLIVAFWLLSIVAAAQSGTPIAPTNPAANWQRYTDKGEEFSAEFPVSPSLWQVNEFEPVKAIVKTYSAYYDGAVFMIGSYERKNKRKTIDDLQNQLKKEGVYDAGQGKRRDIIIEKDFKGVEFSCETPQALNISRFYQARKHLYFVRVLAESDKGEIAKKYLDSFSLVAAPQGQEVSAKREETIADKPVTVPAPTPVPPANVYKAAELTRKAIIVFKPEAIYTEEAQQNGLAGSLQLRVLLSTSGAVSNISPISRLPFGLTEMAITAARNIRFLPAMKDGRRVSQWVQIQYDFNIY